MNNEPDYHDNLFFDNRILKETKKLRDILKLCKGRFEHYTDYSDETMVKIIDKALNEETS